MNNAGALILAGGESRRMDFPKPFLPLNGSTFLGEIVDGYSRAGVKRITVVLNHRLVAMVPDSVRRRRDVEVIANVHPELGRYHSFKTGLKLCGEADHLFVHNCDSPVVNPLVLGEIFRRRLDGDYIVPVYEGRGGHPVLLSRGIVETVLSSGHDYGTLRDLLGKFRRAEVEVDEPSVLLNVNTKADYRRLVENYATVQSG